MARDRELLSSNAAVGRVYSWDGPWVSLGQFQNHERDLIDPTVPWVMRPTGGKAVLHGHDVTVALAAPLSAFGLEEREVKLAYRALAQPLIDALNACGLPTELAERTRFSGRGPRTSDCFAHISPNDMVDPVSGLKRCGSALRIAGGSILMQASIPVGQPLIDPSRVFATPHIPSTTVWDSDRLAEALREQLQSIDATAPIPMPLHP